jgi:hypothetical protein
MARRSSREEGRCEVTAHDEDCDHNEVHHLIIDLGEQVAFAVFQQLNPMVMNGELSPGNAGITTARMIFCGGLETGVRAALIDPIGAQQLLDILDNSTALTPSEVDEANEVIATDARHLMEAVARVAS